MGGVSVANPTCPDSKRGSSARRGQALRELPAAVASPLRGGFVNGVALAFPDGDNDDDQFAIADLINQTITDTPEFDFESVIVA